MSAGHLSSGHRLVYRFFSLPYSQRVAVVQGCFQRARDRGALAALWGQVEALHPDGDTSSNPFGAP